MTRRGPALLAVLGAPASVVLATALVRARGVDPALPATVVVGPSIGSSPMARIDPERSGRSRERLPRTPRILWRARTPGTLDLISVAVDERGAVTIASANVPGLVELDATGRERWRASTGAGPAVTGPVLTSDRTRVVVTTAGEVVGVWPDGRPRFHTDLGLAGRHGRVAPLPSSDGSIAIGIGAEVVIIDADGRPEVRRTLGQRVVGALIATEGGFVATTDDGGVFHLDRSGRVLPLGSFAGDPGPGAAALDSHTLVAVIDHKRLATFDLRARTAETRFTAPSASIDGPVAVGADGTLFVTDFSGIVLGYSTSGAEVRRIALSVTRPSLVSDAGVVNLSAMAESPPLLVDSEGFIAFARVGGGMGILTPDGATMVVRGADCSVPVALAPAGPGRMVVACRDGTVFMIGD